MKELSEAAIEAIGADRVIVAGAVKFVFNDTYRFWSGFGDIEIDDEVYQGVGASGLITPVGGEMGGSADGVTLSLSGLDPDIAATIESEDYHQKPAIVRRLVFAPDGFTLLDSMVFMRGRVDIAPIRETVGGQSAIDFAIEGPRRDMSRRGSRIRSNADQRTLGGALDGAMKHVSIAGRITLYWGQRPAVAAPALGGVGGGGGLNFNFSPSFVPF